MSMTDGAPAPAESAPAPADGAPLANEAPNFSHELPSNIPTDTAKTQEPKGAQLSLDDVIDKAQAKVKTANEAKAKDVPAKDAKPADKPAEVKTEAQKRDGTGKFAPKEGDKPGVTKTVDASLHPVESKPDTAKPQSFTASEAPSRFSPDAKAKWAEAPESVRAETERAIRELTEGHTKYKAAAERDAGLSEFHEMAGRAGKDLRSVLAQYVGMENALRGPDKIGALDQICQRMGVSLKDVAAHIMGQTPEQNASAQDATIRELKATITQLQQQVGTVQQTFQQQQSTAVSKEVAEFAAAHPRFEELHEDIAFFLKTRTNDLEEAYTLAERLNPAPAGAAPQTEASSASVVDLQVQTAKGSKSINGAPSAGSNLPSKKPVRSLDESLDRAFGRTG